MNFIISANTDIGTVKATNQDSVSVKVLNTPQGKMAFAVLCDGMGGLAKGEVASASVILAFDRWIRDDLPQLCSGPIEDKVLRQQWEAIITEQNQKIAAYGAARGIQLGTTVVALLLTQTRYYILNVGDSRVYELSDRVIRLTHDQTVVAREVEMGFLTEQEAERDARRNVLLQCVGASEAVYPELLFGVPNQNTTYMLCSDGFRHEVSEGEIYSYLNPNVLLNDTAMNENAVALIETVKQRGERDNISVAMIRTF